MPTAKARAQAALLTFNFMVELQILIVRGCEDRFMQSQWMDRAMCFDEPPATVVLVSSRPVCAIRDSDSFYVHTFTKRKAVLSKDGPHACAEFLSVGLCDPYR